MVGGEQHPPHACGARERRGSKEQAGTLCASSGGSSALPPACTELVPLCTSLPKKLTGSGITPCGTQLLRSPLTQAHGDAGKSHHPPPAAMNRQLHHNAWKMQPWRTMATACALSQCCRRSSARALTVGWKQLSGARRVGCRAAHWLNQEHIKQTPWVPVQAHSPHLLASFWACEISFSNSSTALLAIRRTPELRAARATLLRSAPSMVLG